MAPRFSGALLTAAQIGDDIAAALTQQIKSTAGPIFFRIDQLFWLLSLIKLVGPCVWTVRTDFTNSRHVYENYQTFPIFVHILRNANIFCCNL